MAKGKLYNEAEKFVKDEFLPNTFDYDCKFDLQKVIHEKLQSDRVSKDPEYYQPREGVVHVSSLYGCLRGVYYEMMGEVATKETEPRTLGVFKAGNLFEDFIVDSMGGRVLDRQTEYCFKYKSLTIVGRDDGTFLDDKDTRRVLEAKSVHSDSFWYRQKEGISVQYHHQIQLQIYLWLRRELFNDEVDGYYSYISKDDCTIQGTPVKYNPKIIEEIVIPLLDLLNEAYEKHDVTLLPIPDPVVFNDIKGSWQKNWLCSYCNHHERCDCPGWAEMAESEVKARNKVLKGK